MPDIILPISPVSRAGYNEVANMGDVDLFNESLSNTNKLVEIQPVLEVENSGSPSIATEFWHKVADFQNEQNRVFSRVHTSKSEEVKVSNTTNIREYNGHMGDNLQQTINSEHTENKDTPENPSHDLKSMMSDLEKLSIQSRGVMKYFANFQAISSSAQALQGGFKQLLNMQ